MENNFKTALSSIYTRNLTISGKNIKQNERNELKALIMQEFAAHLNELFEGSDILECAPTVDGITINIQNESIGSLAVVFNATVKNLDYDFDFECEQYEKELSEKREKKEKKAAEKAEKLRQAAETKERKMKEKERKAN